MALLVLFGGDGKWSNWTLYAQFARAEYWGTIGRSLVSFQRSIRSRFRPPIRRRPTPGSHCWTTPFVLCAPRVDTLSTSPHPHTGHPSHRYIAHLPPQLRSTPISTRAYALSPAISSVGLIRSRLCIRRVDYSTPLRVSGRLLHSGGDYSK